MSERTKSVSALYWKASHKCHYVTITYESGRREQRRMDPDEKKADTMRSELLLGLEREQPPSRDQPVRELIHAFLTWDEANSAKKTHKWHVSFLRSFSQSVSPKLRVSELELHHVEKWLTKHYPRTTNPNTRHAAIACVKRVFNWAVRDMGYFDRNPLAKLQRPPKRHRGTCLSHEQWSTVLTEVGKGDVFHEFLEVLLETGTRPQQARVLEARHCDFDAKVVHFADGEVAGKKGAQSFPLTERATALLRRLALKRPTGPLLLNRDGNPWTPSAVNSRCQRLKKKLPFRAFCYAARHSYAMDLIDAGASAGIVSTALGHRDKTVVLKVYGDHFDQRDKRLRECVEEAARQRQNDRKQG